MAYQSLYRRYRPQKFSEIRGQQHIVSALKNAVAKGEVGHAYMFHGPRGTGKTTSARVLAKALNCTILGDDSEPCGECESCVAIEEGRSFDLHELDAASNNGVDDMRDLLAKVSLGTPGNAKVYILDEVHMLTRGAENALLKTLEEPPAGTTLFLLTSRPYDLLDTIRSRCLNFRIPAGIETIAHPDWSAWTEDYHAWLNSLLQGPNKQTIPHIMFGSYGLNARFQAILAEMTSSAWKAHKAELPDHVSSEEKDAMEAGMSRGYRKQLFGEIEKATVRFARAIESAHPGQLPVAALNRATETLEHSAGLLELNFNQAAALEMFFLKSLRIWSSAR